MLPASGGSLAAPFYQLFMLLFIQIHAQVDVAFKALERRIAFNDFISHGKTSCLILSGGFCVWIACL